MSELSKTIAVIGLLAPIGAGALGIGDIRSHSSLNQPLTAEIPLVLSGSDKLNNIQVRLASLEAFERAGVERLHALTQLQFKPVAKPDGRHTIQVSSRDVIQETFLDFLVEVESPQGTLLREFTLLLDPSRAVSQTSSPIRESFASDQPDQSWDGSRYNESPRHDRADPSPKTHYSNHENPSATSAIEYSGETYGPVRRREKLIDIASRIQRPGSVTRAQMAAGLFLANPHAFKGTKNRLQAGSILRIPGEEYLSRINPGGSDQTLAKHSGQPPIDWQDEKSVGTPAGTGGGAVTEVSSRIPLALKRENEELRQQLSLLEQRLEEAQRMLALKNAELATLHYHEATKSAAMAEPPNPMEPLLQSTPPAIEPTQPAQTVEASPVAVKAPEPATPTQQAPNAPQTKAAPAQLPKPFPTAPIPATHVESVDSMESLMAPEFWQASGALTALGLAAWLYRRRRAIQEARDTPVDSLAADQPDEADLTPPAPYDHSAIATPVASLVASESPVTADVLDPLWETDVYLRYGRFTQAEALMRETIRNEPSRDDLKQKLFEVLHLANKSEALAEYFHALQSEKPNLASSFWLPMQAMRPELFLSATPTITDLPEDLIVSVVQPAPDSSIVEEIELTPVSTGDETSLPTLDLDNTDFTAELRALEEASTRAQPDQDSDGPIVLEPDFGLDLENLDGINDVAVIPETGESTTSVEINDLVSELVASVSVDSAMPEQDGTLPLDPEDTRFEEELETLETQYRLEEPEATSSPAVPLTQAIDGADEPDPAESTQEVDNLLAFDTSELNLQFDQVTASATSSEIQLDNLIAFDLSDLDATLSSMSFKPNRVETAPEILTPPTSTIGMAELFPDMPLPGFAVSKEAFGSLDFELELIDPAASMTSDAGAPKVSESLSIQIGSERDDFNKQLEEARQLAERNEKSAARAILQEIQQRGNSDQKAAADELLNEMTKVRLSLVPPASRKVS